MRSTTSTGYGGRTLDTLPTEVKNKIFSHFFLGKNVKYSTKGKSPGHRYKFNTSIMLVNRNRPSMSVATTSSSSSMSNGSPFRSIKADSSLTLLSEMRPRPSRIPAWKLLSSIRVPIVDVSLARTVPSDIRKCQRRSLVLY
jgi:hypothetical protein